MYRRTTVLYGCKYDTIRIYGSRYYFRSVVRCGSVRSVRSVSGVNLDTRGVVRSVLFDPPRSRRKGRAGTGIPPCVSEWFVGGE